MTWIAVGLGGAVGSALRYGVNIATNRFAGETVPYATAVVNVVGCLLAGMLLGSVDSSKLDLTDARRAFLFTGILGGFTTFSSLALDTLVLVRNGEGAVAALNLGVQLSLGMFAVFLGYWLLK